MSDCCLTNLGCLQIPTEYISTVGQQGPPGNDGDDGDDGGAGAQGAPGFTRVAYNLPPILSGAGSPKTFVTTIVDAEYMPQEEGSSLVLTFNVKTNNNAALIKFAINTRQIGIRFGGQECIFAIGNKLPISIKQVEVQFKVEIIRASVATEAYARVSVNGLDLTTTGPICYNESNLLTGLNFNDNNAFIIHGIQNAPDTFRFSTLTVDKITAL